MVAIWKSPWWLTFQCSVTKCGFYKLCLLSKVKLYMYICICICLCFSLKIHKLPKKRGWYQFFQVERNQCQITVFVIGCDAWWIWTCAFIIFHNNISSYMVSLVMYFPHFYKIMNANCMYISNLGLGEREANYSIIQ